MPSSDNAENEDARVRLGELLGRRWRVALDVPTDEVPEKGHREGRLGLELCELGLGRCRHGA